MPERKKHAKQMHVLAVTLEGLVPMFSVKNVAEIVRRTLGAEGAADLETEVSAPPVRGAEDPAMDTP